jgi:hypothetical protein
MKRSPRNPRRVLLHVGLPKTATSALQRWLHSNGSQLEAAGARYPGGAHLSGDKHQFMVGQLRNRGIASLEGLLAERRQETVLLSSEGLSNHFYDFREEALERFREDTSAHRVEVVMLVRQPERWLHSYHKQCVINPVNGASELWGTSMTERELADHPRIRKLMDIRQLSSDIARGFGARQMHILNFEEDWFSDFLGLLSLDPGKCPPLPRVNESPPGWAVEILRCLNGLGLPKQRADYWRSLLGSATRSTHLELTSPACAVPASVTDEAVCGDIDRLEPLLSRQTGAQDHQPGLEFLASLRMALGRSLEPTQRPSP